MRTRLLGHRNDLEKGQHPNIYLQRAWRKHGPEAFICGVLEDKLEKAVLLEKESQWIEVLQTCVPKFGYNLKRIWEGRIVYTDDSKLRMRESALVWSRTPENRDRQQKLARQLWQDPNFRARQEIVRSDSGFLSHLSKVCAAGSTPETREISRQAQLLRWTPEARRGQSEKLKKSNPMDQLEARAKSSKALTGRELSDDHCEKISKFMKENNPSTRPEVKVQRSKQLKESNPGRLSENRRTSSQRMLDRQRQPGYIHPMNKLENRKKASDRAKGTIWIHRGEDKKHIRPDEFEDYQIAGWVRGLGTRRL